MNSSVMAKEAREAPLVIQNQLSSNDDNVKRIADKLRSINPPLIYMIGRGSSDHAGVFGKYLFETELGIPVCSAALSIAGVFNKQLKLNNAVAFVISQSGRSPDILRQAESAKQGGAFTIAIVNDETSPLAYLADAVIPISAGEEKAVAATKSYLATLSALLHLCAHWAKNEKLLASLQLLPASLDSVVSAPMQLTTDFLKATRNCIILGRGFGYAIGREVALKLKEVLGIHAEAFSSAEFIHGPVTLVEQQLKIVSLLVNDESEALHRGIMGDVISRGAQCTEINSGRAITAARAITDSGLHPRLLPLLIMQRFYLDIEHIAVDMGLNPDTPPGLNKVTKTQ